MFFEDPTATIKPDTTNMDETPKQSPPTKQKNNKMEDLDSTPHVFHTIPPDKVKNLKITTPNPKNFFNSPQDSTSKLSK